MCFNKGLNSFPKQLPWRSTSLILGGNNIGIIRPYSLVSGSLSYVSLSNNGIMSIEPYGLSGLYSLVYLVLNMNELKKIEKYTFSGLKKLKHLNLEENLIKYIHEDAFKELTNLQKLTVKNNPLSTIAEKTFQLETLFFLNLEDCQIKWDSTYQLLIRRSLRTLKLLNNKISGIGSKFLPNDHRIISLNLRGMDIHNFNSNMVKNGKISYFYVKNGELCGIVESYECKVYLD
ncbi:DgyrCDS109 [Dimorphilus gyrociliatus]|uniref:DgyrCDS109 n=1 Tax=Dimorphilus gyrociliatus TaxID=2664684 RepID=A0A7I8V553_9ANNE|nr:DgyrCDS109 [Dimorphilus gyrociliatus]